MLITFFCRTQNVGIVLFKPNLAFTDFNICKSIKWMERNQRRIKVPRAQMRMVTNMTNGFHYGASDETKDAIKSNPPFQDHFSELSFIWSFPTCLICGSLREWTNPKNVVVKNMQKCPTDYKLIVSFIHLFFSMNVDFYWPVRFLVVVSTWKTAEVFERTGIPFFLLKQWLLSFTSALHHRQLQDF